MQTRQNSTVILVVSFASILFKDIIHSQTCLLLWPFVAVYQSFSKDTFTALVKSSTNSKYHGKVTLLPI